MTRFKKADKTDVIFRKDDTGIYAIFPHIMGDGAGNVLCYQHVGQHCVGNYNACIRYSKPAKEAEYKPLLKELREIGYKLNIVRRMNRKKYNAAYDEMLEQRKKFR